MDQVHSALGALLRGGVLQKTGDRDPQKPEIPRFAIECYIEYNAARNCGFGPQKLRDCEDQRFYRHGSGPGPANDSYGCGTYNGIFDVGRALLDELRFLRSGA